MATNSAGTRSGNPVVVPVISGPTLVTMTSSVTNNTVTAYETRNGEWATYRVLVNYTGAPSAGNLVISLPAGRTINSTIMVNSSLGSGNPIPGSSGIFYDTSALLGWPLSVCMQSTTSVIPFWWDDIATGVIINNSIQTVQPVTIATGDTVTLNFSVPILEWAGSANVAYGAGLATNLKSGLASYESSGSFTVHLKNPAAGSLASGTAFWYRIGKVVTISLPALSLTTTQTTFTLSDSSTSAVNTWPADLVPLRSQNVPIIVTEGGTNTTTYTGLLNLTSAGVFNIARYLEGSGFGGASAVKGLPIPQTVSYNVS